MRLYAAICKVDEEQRIVQGYASTEAKDSQGEIVHRAAIEAALPDYLEFANVREMHQPSAVGVAQSAEVDDHGLYISAKIVDDNAWKKVISGVYKGFSIGGKITARDRINKALITGIKLSEISLVDRPANPEARFDLWKADGQARDGESKNSPESILGKEELRQVWIHPALRGRHFMSKSEAVHALTEAPSMVQGESAAESKTMSATTTADDTLGKIAVDLGAARAALAKMTAAYDGLVMRLMELEAEPGPTKARLRYIPIAKAADGGALRHDRMADTSNEELDPTHELIKVALKTPVPLTKL